MINPIGAKHKHFAYFFRECFGEFLLKTSLFSQEIVKNCQSSKIIAAVTRQAPSIIMS